MSNGKRSFRSKSTRPRRPPAKRRGMRKRPAALPRNVNKAKPLARGGTYKPTQPQRQVGYLPFAKVFQARLPYVNSVGITANLAGTATGFYFNLNSVFNPNTLLAQPDQPQQFAQLKALYNSYLVHACKLNVEFTNPTADTVFVGINIYSPEGGLTAVMNGKTLAQISEHRNTRMSSLVNTGQQKKNMSLYIPIHTLLGIPKLVYTADRERYASDINSFPIQEAFLEVLILDTNGVASTVMARVSLTYYVEFFDFVTQQQSTSA